MPRATRLLVALAVGLACALAGVACVPAASPTVSIRVTSGNVAVEGRVVVRFAGDRRGGCARVGLCGYRGALIWRPAGRARLWVMEEDRQGRRTTSAGLSLSFADPRVLHAAVVRGEPGGGGGICRDSVVKARLLLPLRREGRAMTFTLLPALARPGLFATRCAGPLDPDLARALPVGRIPLAAIAHGRTTIGLGGTRRFAAGGLAGTVRSTLRLHVKAMRSHLERDVPVALPAIGRPVRRDLTVTYRVERAAATFEQDLATMGDRGLCRRLDACGLRARQRVTAVATGGELSITAFGAPREDLEAAFGLRPPLPARPVALAGSSALTAGGGLVSTVTRAKGVPCVAASRGLPDLVVDVHSGHRPGALDVSALTSRALRTRCPGPEPGDGFRAVLARGRVPASTFRSARPVLRLHATGMVSRNGFAGPWRGTLLLELRRVAIDGTPALGPPPGG